MAETPDMEAVIAKIKKLLALGQNNDNEHQAAAAMAKVQELLEAYNLDMSALGSSGKGAQRSDTTKKGGLYSWQRKLWEAVATLNFCYYVSLKGLQKGAVYEHRLIGSHANVVATEVMAKYLQETIERLAQRWAKDTGYSSVFVREAIAYREGMSARIVDRLHERRYAVLEEERQREEERKREEARTGVAPNSTALTLVSVISTEADFNNDYLQGWEMGTTAKNRHERELRQKAWEAANAEKQRKWDEWAKAHPEEAARIKAQLEAENKAWWEKYRMKKGKSRSQGVARERRLTAEEQRMRLGAYHEGHARGGSVSIDQQIDKANTARIG